MRGPLVFIFVVACAVVAAPCAAQGGSPSTLQPAPSSIGESTPPAGTDFAGLDAELAAAIGASRAQVTCTAVAGAPPSRLVTFVTQDGRRRVNVSALGAASPGARDSTSAGGASPAGAAATLAGAEVFVTDRRPGGVMEHAELQADGSVAVRRSAARQVEGETQRSTESVTYRAGDRLADQVSALARRALATACP